MPERLLTIRTGRHPHEILILVASVIVGIVGVIIPRQVSPSVTDAMHGWVLHSYYFTLAGFSALALYGIFKRRIEGLLIERVGITIVALYYALFAYCVFANYGVGGVMGALLPIAYAIANMARAWQIGADLKLLRSYLQDHPEAHGLR